MTWHEYWLDGQRVPGVTTAIKGVGGADGLVNWASGVVAAYAYDNRERLAELSRDEYLDLVPAAARRVRDEAKNAGVQVHAIAHALLSGAPVQVPDHLRGHVDATVDFMERHDVQDLISERPVASRRWQYAGTLDLVARLADGRVWLLDYKTGASVWLTVALQLAAYRFAEIYVDDDGAEHPMTPVDACGVVKIGPDGWELLPVIAGRDQHRVFLNALATHRFAKLKVDELIRPALAVPGITNASLPIRDNV
jgi:hypothetical protein